MSTDHTDITLDLPVCTSNRKQVCSIKRVQTYLICDSSYNSNRKCKDEGNATSKQNPPPWKLELFLVIFTSKDRSRNVNNQDHPKPPLGGFLVPCH